MLRPYRRPHDLDSSARTIRRGEVDADYMTDGTSSAVARRPASGSYKGSGSGLRAKARGFAQITSRLFELMFILDEPQRRAGLRVRESLDDGRIDRPVVESWKRHGSGSAPRRADRMAFKTQT
jgi:hypothetical protein